MTDSEKIRYKRLQLVCKKALEESIKKSLSLEQIKKCYPIIASSEEGVKSLEIARSQIINFWFNNSMKEFDLIFQERDIENGLDGLDEVIEKAKRRSLDKNDKPVEINKLTPEEIIQANIRLNRNSSTESLRLIHNQLRSENLQFFNQLNGLFEESQAIKTNLNELLIALNKEMNILKKDESNVRIDELMDTIVDER